MEWTAPGSDGPPIRAGYRGGQEISTTASTTDNVIATATATSYLQFEDTAAVEVYNPGGLAAAIAGVADATAGIIGAVVGKVSSSVEEIVEPETTTRPTEQELAMDTYYYKK